jgi:anthranilate synthase/aminodeoxychorismate synthase-like glutamine amidotransferase
MAGKPELLILDNHDSFTYNLVQLIRSCGVSQPTVLRSTEVQPDDCKDFQQIILSPGPGLPDDFPMLKEVIEKLGPTHRILGICLGHQAIAETYGATLRQLSWVRHGQKTPLLIRDKNEILFRGIDPRNNEVGLYHSWEVDSMNLPGTLEVTAETTKGEILALKHRSHDVKGVQFHPESIMTEMGKRMIKNWLSFFLLLLMGLFFSCTRTKYEVDDNKVFRYNEEANITSLDPAFARDQANIWAVNQLFNGLVQLDEKIAIQPCIAKNWVISEDGQTYTFFLRDDVWFHNDPCFPDGKGRRVKASDFVYSFHRIKSPETASAGAWIFGNTASGEAAFIARNDTTLEINLKQPFPPFLGILTMIYAVAVPSEAIDTYGDTFRKHPVGSGPFRFAYWKEGVKLVLLKNPNYFEQDNGTQLPYLESVAISFMEDKQAAFMQFLQGKLDFMSGIDPAYKDELLTPAGELNPDYNNRFRLIKMPYLNTEYLGILMDHSHKPLNNKNVRQAINLAFDRKKMIRFLRNNIGTPGIYGIIPPGMPGFDSSRIWYQYQPDRARILLEQAGYQPNNPIPSIKLLTTPDYLDLCKYIQHQVGQIGITLDLEVIPPAAMKEMKAQAKIPFFRASWIADYPDAENYLSLFYGPNFCPKGPNYTHFDNAAYNALFELAMMESNHEKRMKYYQELEAMVMDASPVVVLYYDEVLRFVARDVHGLGINPMNLLTLKRVWKGSRW